MVSLRLLPRDIEGAPGGTRRRLTSWRVLVFRLRGLWDKVLRRPFRPVRTAGSSVARSSPELADDHVDSPSPVLLWAVDPGSAPEFRQGLLEELLHIPHGQFCGLGPGYDTMTRDRPDPHRDPEVEPPRRGDARGGGPRDRTAHGGAGPASCKASSRSSGVGKSWGVWPPRPAIGDSRYLQVEPRPERVAERMNRPQGEWATRFRRMEWPPREGTVA